MRQCEKCGYIVENENAKFCRKCGAKLPVLETEISSTKETESINSDHITTDAESNHNPEIENNKPVGSVENQSNGYDRQYTPGSITSLQPNEIFVFGSNIHGMHGGGAAQIAYKKFGAEWGVGEGLTGQCYALPTMEGGVDYIRGKVQDFLECAKAHPELKFLVTKIACGIAGFSTEQIGPLFADAITMENVILPREFVETINIQHTDIEPSETIITNSNNCDGNSSSEYLNTIKSFLDELSWTYKIEDNRISFACNGVEITYNQESDKCSIISNDFSKQLFYGSKKRCFKDVIIRESPQDFNQTINKYNEEIKSQGCTFQIVGYIDNESQAVRYQYDFDSNDEQYENADSFYEECENIINTFCNFAEFYIVERNLQMGFFYDGTGKEIIENALNNLGIEWWGGDYGYIGLNYKENYLNLCYEDLDNDSCISFTLYTTSDYEEILRSKNLEINADSSPNSIYSNDGFLYLDCKVQTKTNDLSEYIMQGLNKISEFTENLEQQQ